jgi:hypothetical protein
MRLAVCYRHFPSPLPLLVIVQECFHGKNSQESDSLPVSTSRRVGPNQCGTQTLKELGDSSARLAEAEKVARIRAEEQAAALEAERERLVQVGLAPSCCGFAKCNMPQNQLTMTI